MENFTDVKLEIFVPQEYALKIRDELAKIGVGRIGNYDHCVAMSPVQGYYRPLPGADPFEGKIEKISEVKEYKLEVNCRRELVNDALKVIKKSSSLRRAPGQYHSTGESPFRDGEHVGTMRANLPFIFQALLAALFFGASAPLSKLLLGEVPPVLMAAFLYLGSGTGISLVKLSQRMTSNQKEAGIRRPDVGWLAGAIIAGGILAPIILMVSLQVYAGIHGLPAAQL